MPKHTVVSALVIAGFASSAAMAATQKDFSVMLGVGHSDNVGKQSVNERSETIKAAGLDFAVMQDTRRFSLTSTADLEYLDYQTNAYDGVVGNLSGVAKVRLVPDRFEWLFQDNFGQVLSDPFTPDTPDNRRNINYFTTGPDFLLGLGNANKATLSGRYSSVNYENKATNNNAYIDNDRYSAAVGLLHELSAVSQLSLELESEKINFANDAPVADYDQKQAFLSYQLKGSRTTIETDAGYAEVSGATVDDSSYLARFSIERKSTPYSTISLRLGHEFSDVGASFRLQQTLQPTGLQAQSTTQNSNPFITEYINVGWQLNRQRTSVGLDLSYFDDSYEKQPSSDQTRVVGSVSVSRLITPNLRLLLAGNYSKADPKQISNTVGSYHELDETLGLSWQFSQHLACDVEYGHYDRSSSLTVGSYEENRGWLRLRYGLARR